MRAPARNSRIFARFKVLRASAVFLGAFTCTTPTPEPPPCTSARARASVCVSRSQRSPHTVRRVQSHGQGFVVHHVSCAGAVVPGWPRCRRCVRVATTDVLPCTPLLSRQGSVQCQCHAARAPQRENEREWRVVPGQGVDHRHHEPHGEEGGVRGAGPHRSAGCGAGEGALAGVSAFLFF